MDAPVPVTVFTDFTDPFSYVTEAALRAAAGERKIAVSYRAMETSPPPAALPEPAALSERLRQASGPAAAEGLPLRPPPLVPRTRKAHEAALFAADRECGEQMRAAIHLAYWDRGEDIGRVDVLVEIGAVLGLVRDDLKIALDIDSYTDRVLRDGEIARRLRVAAPPTLYLGEGRDARILVGLQTRHALDAAFRAR